MNPRTCVPILIAAVGLCTVAGNARAGDPPQARFGAHFYVDSGTQSELYLYNPHAERDVAHVTVFDEGSVAIPLPPIVLPPYASRTLSLRDAVFGDRDLPEHGEGNWGDGSRMYSTWGSVVVVSSGIRGTIRSVDSGESLVSSEHLSSESIQETVVPWNLPRARSHLIFALQNPTSTTVTVRSSTPYCGIWFDNDFVLEAFETRLLAMEDILPSSHTTTRSLTRFTGLSGAEFRGQLLILDEDKGFSSQQPMRSMAAGVRHSDVLHMGPADPNLGFPEGTVFQPVLHIASAASDFIAIEVDVRFGDLEGTFSYSLWPLSLLSLEPDRLLGVAAEDLPAGTTGEITIRGLPGETGAIVVTTGGHNNRTSLRFSAVDLMETSDGTGERLCRYTFGDDAVEDTEVRLRNVGDVETEVSVILHVDGIPSGTVQDLWMVAAHSNWSSSIENILAGCLPPEQRVKQLRGWAEVRMPADVRGGFSRFDSHAGLCEDIRLDEPGDLE